MYRCELIPQSRETFYLAPTSLLLLPTLFGALIVGFLLIHLIPGDPVEVMLGETASGADKQELRRTLGLDQPWLTQYRNFLTNFATGDLGRSLYEQASVGAIIGARLPATLAAGVVRHDRRTSHFISPGVSGRGRAAAAGSIACALFFSLLGLSLPNFWLGPLLMILFSIQLGWTPVSGRGGSAIYFTGADARLGHGGYSDAHIARQFAASRPHEVRANAPAPKA